LAYSNPNDNPDFHTNSPITHVHPDQDTQTNPNDYAYLDPMAYADANTYTLPLAHSNPHGFSHSNQYRPFTNPNSLQNSQVNPNAYHHLDSLANTDADTKAFSLAHSIKNIHPISEDANTFYHPNPNDYALAYCDTPHPYTDLHSLAYSHLDYPNSFRLQYTAHN
jgi:hypothetical protein